MVGAGLVIAGWAAACAVTLVLTDHRLRAGVAQAKVVRAHLGAAQLTGGAAQAPLRAAAGDFAAARRLLGEPWVAPLRLVPLLGRQVTSATDLAQAAATISQAGSQALPRVRALLSGPHQTPATRAGLIEQLAGVVARLNGRVDRVDLGPSGGLVSALGSERGTFAADLASLRYGLRRAQGATAAVADLLGRSRTYLVLSANNAEMRAGSGMFLAAGTLTTADGALQLGRFTATSDLVVTGPTVPVEGDLAFLWGSQRPSQDYRELALSPQFPASAALAARMWQAQTGVAVDGVLALDTAALAQILDATGPVDAGGVTVSGGYVEQYLLHDQYAGVGSDQSSQAARHDHEGALAAAAFAALSVGHPDLGALAAGLDTAANGRHLLAWASDPAVEADWQDAGVSGALGPSDLLLSVLNQGADKLDPFLSVRASLAAAVVQPSPGPRSGQTAVTVTVTVTDSAPADLPGYVAGADGDPPVPGTYVGAVAVDIPGRAGRESASAPLEAEGPDGPSFAMAVPVVLRPGGTTTVTFRFVLDGARGRIRVAPSARLPATLWAGPGGRFDDATSHWVAW